MKKIISLILCLSLLAGLCACAEPEPRQPGNFYYYRPDTHYGVADGVIAPEQRELAQIGGDIGAMLATYCRGPVTRSLECPIPREASVDHWSLKNGVLTIDFSPNFAELSGIELTIAAGCLARTFLELTEATEITITAGGALLDGESAITLGAADLDLYDNSLDRLRSEFTVYYADAQRRYLIGHEISVNLAGRENIPAYLLEQLLQPPPGSGLRSALPAGTRILGVSVEDGTCTVNLSQEFESAAFDDRNAQLLSLMSVVNTLTALEEIDRVEFSTDGNLLIRCGSIQIPEPLVGDSRFLGPVRTGLGESDVTLYLANGSESRLVPVPARVRRTAAISDAGLILRTLLADPGVNDLSTLIPAGTHLNRVTVENHICFVDLSAEYLSSTDHLPYSARVIAASLCALDGIYGVQITVDGAVPGEFDVSWFGVLTPKDHWYL